MMPMKPKKDPQSSALEALMGEESSEPSDNPTEEAGEMKSNGGDAASVIASIQSELDKLSKLLA